MVLNGSHFLGDVGSAAVVLSFSYRQVQVKKGIQRKVICEMIYNVMKGAEIFTFT